MISTKVINNNAFKSGIVVPAFNVPYLPMVGPII